MISMLVASSSVQAQPSEPDSLTHAVLSSEHSDIVPEFDELFKRLRATRPQNGTVFFCEQTGALARIVDLKSSIQFLVLPAHRKGFRPKPVTREDIEKLGLPLRQLEKLFDSFGASSLQITIRATPEPMGTGGNDHVNEKNGAIGGAAKVGSLLDD
ncbi:hypothetical protein [Stieleria neptunia]|nr:hypothetical protein [Stieleria neptunia]